MSTIKSHPSSRFRWILDPNGDVVIVGLIARNATRLDVPAKIVGRPVVAIGAKAFKGFQALQSIVLPEGLQTIGAKAFSDCPSLRSATFPASLQTIESQAFTRCFLLRSVVFWRQTRRNLRRRVLPFPPFRLHRVAKRFR